MNSSSGRFPAGGRPAPSIKDGLQALRTAVSDFVGQVRLALGLKGVVWATAAGLVGLTCCAVSLVVVALSLESSEVDGVHDEVAAYATADQAFRDFMRHVLAARSDMLQPGDRAPVHAGWQRARTAIDGVCAVSRAGQPADLVRLCTDVAVFRPRLDATIDAFAFQGRPLPAAAVTELLSIGRHINGLVTQGVRTANALVRTMSDQFAGAILVLSLSTAGFAGAGLILIVLVGHASMLHHQQWQKAATAAEQAGRLSRRLEEQVAEVERGRLEYAALVGSLSDAVTRVDAKTGIVTFASAATADLYGVPPEKVVGTSVLDYIAEEDRADTRAGAIAALKGASPGTVSLQYRVDVDGRKRHVETRFRKTRGPDGRSTLIGVTRDIEDRVQLAEQLERQAAQLRSIVESSGALVVLLDGDFNVAMVNSAFAALAGVDQADAVGRSLKELLRCSFDDSIVAVWRAGRSRAPVRFTNRLEDRQGRERQISCTATPILDAGGRLTNIVFLGIDDTDRVEAEQALFDAQRYATLGEMAGAVAHEMAQPLQTINIAGSAALEELVSESDRPLDRPFLTQRLERIMRQVERANAIIGELRAFVRGTAQDQPENFALAPTVRGAAELAQHGFIKSKVALSVSLADDLALVRGHASRFEQVLVNLINNARDAGASRIDLQAYAVRAGASQRVIIRVEDNGPGISDKVLPRLFERFITTKPRGMGTGLGLRICRRIVEDMGGSITAGNRREGGAYFDIVLPAAQARAGR